ncbi:hypothetical protein HY623_01010 [Candidatus Uhrbacteria bacterium]|nr:hypothetical protein [Candidatus Uhrbacteria bacterium]
MQPIDKLCAFILIASVLVVPLPSAATPFEYDVSISPGSVIFVPRDIYAGERVRVYANIANLGSKDVTGYVGFYQGPNLLAPVHPFSLRVDSVTEDVWIDWTPAEGRYNIMVKVDTDVSDQSPSNNAFLTPMMLIAKRPSPPPQPQPTQPTGGQQNQNGAPTQVSEGEIPQKKAELKKTVTKKLAQTIGETLTPKLPLNPPADRNTQKVLESRPSTGAQTQRADVPVQAVSEPQPTPSPDVSQQPTPIAPQAVKGERAFADRVPQTPLKDSTRRALLVGILLAAASLAAGGFFLHKSKV